MKHTLIILAVFFAAITALHAQAIDPALHQALSSALPPSLVIYIPLFAYCVHAFASIRRARANGLNWPDAILAFLEGTNVPTPAGAIVPASSIAAKASLLLGALCLLSMTSCAGLTAFIASPLGQTTLITAEALGKQLANAAEESVVAQIITKATGQVALLQAQGVNADTTKEIVRQSELAGLQAVIDAAQNQYIGMTGAKYVIPLTPAPVPAATKG